MKDFGNLQELSNGDLPLFHIIYYHKNFFNIFHKKKTDLLKNINEQIFDNFQFKYFGFWKIIKLRSLQNNFYLFFKIIQILSQHLY